MANLYRATMSFILPDTATSSRLGLWLPSQCCLASNTISPALVVHDRPLGGPPIDTPPANTHSPQLSPSIPLPPSTVPTSIMTDYTLVSLLVLAAAVTNMAQTVPHSRAATAAASRAEVGGASLLRWGSNSRSNSYGRRLQAAYLNEAPVGTPGYQDEDRRQGIAAARQRREVDVRENWHDESAAMVGQRTQTACILIFILPVSYPTTPPHTHTHTHMHIHAHLAPN